jgi:hypothetical protein
MFLFIEFSPHRLTQNAYGSQKYNHNHIDFYANMCEYRHNQINKTKRLTNKMETTTDGIEPVTLSEVLALDTWNEARTSDQLQNFISRRHQEVGTLDIEE